MFKEVKISKKASKVINSLPSNTKKLINDKIKLLEINPEALKNNIKKLQGHNDLFRLRVGDYRVVYTDSMEILYIIKVGTRGGIY